MLELPVAAIGPIIASLIAAAFGFLGLVISKEQKTSAFRQEWIDSLRQEASELVAHLNAAADGWATKGNDPGASPLRENMLGANRAMTQIRLRLNPSEDQSKAALKMLKAAEDAFLEEELDLDGLRELEQCFVEQTKKF
jgi:hypothetical protein